MKSPFGGEQLFSGTLSLSTLFAGVREQGAAATWVQLMQAAHIGILVR